MAPRPPPTWDDIPAEQALRHSFDFSSGRWVQQAIVVKIDREFFARGSLRYAYYMQELSGNSVDVRTLRDRGNSAHSGVGVGTLAMMVRFVGGHFFFRIRMSRATGVGFQ